MRLCIVGFGTSAQIKLRTDSKVPHALHVIVADKRGTSGVKFRAPIEHSITDVASPQDRPSTDVADIVHTFEVNHPHLSLNCSYALLQTHSRGIGDDAVTDGVARRKVVDHRRIAGHGQKRRL